MNPTPTTHADNQRAEQTATPWQYTHRSGTKNKCHIHPDIPGDGQYKLIADGVDATDAAFIVQAVNSHASLVAALDDADSWLQDIIERSADCQPFVTEYINDIKLSYAKVAAALAYAKG